MENEVLLKHTLAKSALQQWRAAAAELKHEKEILGNAARKFLHRQMVAGWTVVGRTVGWTGGRAVG